MSRPDAPEADLLLKRQIPAWLLSLAIHASALLAVAMVVPHAPQGAAEEPSRVGGIVLVTQDQGPPEYFSEEEAGGSLTGDAEPIAAASEAAAAQAKAPELSNKLAGLLPQGNDSIAGSDSVGEAENAAAMSAAGAPGTKFGAGHGYAQTGVFGVTGTGTKFVYVFDRSGSMEGFQGRPLAAAKRELLASLENLDSIHQFQIIFYNERPTILNPNHSAQPRMLFGSDSDKRIATDFVQGIIADGGTRHLEALELALRMKPDVIFFLTDADYPPLTAEELTRIRQTNKRVGASINAIEFGSGPNQSSDNFLMRIAKENGGQHAYVDVSRLPRAR